MRDNNTPTDWVLASLSAESEGDLALCVVGSGNGGTNELRERLTQDNIVRRAQPLQQSLDCDTRGFGHPRPRPQFFGLVRTTETIDNTVAVKFVAISFIGEAIGVMRKARISTLRGDIKAAFDPFHCELLNVSSRAEVTVAAVTAQLGAMFGGEVERRAGPASMRIGQRMVTVSSSSSSSTSTSTSMVTVTHTEKPLRNP